jgi:nucleoside-diphosphate-sugar epimerase
MSEAGGNLLCFGMGYTARALAASLGGSAWTVTATIRDGETDLSRERNLVAFDGAETALAAASHVLVSTPPGEAGDPVLARYGVQLAAHRTLAWVGYLSTSGVYGDTGGARADETTVCVPSNARSRWRLEAEEAWSALDIPAHIFRLAGIYGPGRSTLDQVRAGTARRIERPGYKFSRIHVDDIANVLRASMALPEPGAIYNVCDDEPAAQSEIVAYACDLLAAEVPPLIPFEEAAPGMSAMARSFWSDNRLIDNARLKRDLGVTLIHPNYRSGLAAILVAEKAGQNTD